MKNKSKKRSSIYSSKAEAILNETTSFCQNECPNREGCFEEDCVLWRIEQIITEGK